MVRYYNMLFLAAITLVLSVPSEAFAARKGIGSVVGMVIIAGIAFAFYLIKLAVRRAKDLKSDVQYHDAMKSGQLASLSDDDKEVIDQFIVSYLDTAHKAAADPDVDINRLELAVYDKMMAGLSKTGLLVSPDFRKELKKALRVAIATGAQVGQVAKT